MSVSSNKCHKCYHVFYPVTKLEVLGGLSHAVPITTIKGKILNVLLACCTYECFIKKNTVHSFKLKIIKDETKRNRKRLCGDY